MISTLIHAKYVALVRTEAVFLLACNPTVASRQTPMDEPTYHFRRALVCADACLAECIQSLLLESQRTHTTVN